MCARFTLTLTSYAELARALGVEIAGAVAEHYHPRYNAAPAGTHLLLRVSDGKRELLPARWGFVPRWAKDPSIGAKLINARAETAHEKPAFRDAFARRRCVVPADGFYEWGGPKSARQPFWFHATKGGLLYLAGLYEAWKDPETGLAEPTFTILTTPANQVVGQLHVRMPALIEGGELDAWLGAPGAAQRDLEQLLRPAANDALSARRVSTRVNSAANDDARLIEEVAGDPPGQARKGETLPLFKL